MMMIVRICTLRNMYYRLYIYPSMHSCMRVQLNITAVTRNDSKSPQITYAHIIYNALYAHAYNDTVDSSNLTLPCQDGRTHAGISAQASPLAAASPSPQLSSDTLSQSTCACPRDLSETIARLNNELRKAI
jgi:hypothetical protein